MKKLKAGFSLQSIFYKFPPGAAQCEFLFIFTRHPGSFAGRITFVVGPAAGKCICIESTGAPLGFIENNCGNHSWEKKLRLLLQFSNYFPVNGKKIS